MNYICKKNEYIDMSGLKNLKTFLENYKKKSKILQKNFYNNYGFFLHTDYYNYVKKIIK